MAIRRDFGSCNLRNLSCFSCQHFKISGKEAGRGGEEEQEEAEEEEKQKERLTQKEKGKDLKL